MSNPLDSRKTKLLYNKTVDFSINKKHFHQITLRKAKITILFLLENPKNNNNILVLVFSISPIQRIGH
jgi:hypothetical protein